jgi:2-polyprenyl-6-methoxyphenol hydroxylase-like FAD-dependent oxidoreductase
MTEQDWLTLNPYRELSEELRLVAQPRKLFLLGTAFLRRVWDVLNDWERLSVETTEQFAFGRVSATDLMQTWCEAEAATGEGVWLDADSNDTLRLGCPCCLETLDRQDAEPIHPGVRAAVRDPGGFATLAALHARRLVGDGATSQVRDLAIQTEARAQYDLYRDIVGDPFEKPRPRPSWARFPGVRELLLSVERREAIEALAMFALADALEEAGCTECPLLDHCRSSGPHVRGCCVIEVLAGRSARQLPAVEARPTRKVPRAW